MLKSPSSLALSTPNQCSGARPPFAMVLTPIHVRVGPLPFQRNALWELIIAPFLVIMHAEEHRMNIPSAENTSQDERVLAAVAHATVALPYVGFIGPLAIWITQRDWSRFVAFHALQALVFQILQSVVITLAFLCGFVEMIPFFFSTFSPAMDHAPEWLIFFPLGIQTAGLCLVLLLVLAFLVIGLTAAGRTLTGRDFQYPVIARWIQR